MRSFRFLTMDSYLKLGNKT